MIAPFTMFLLLIVGHALADYPLQGEFIAKAKNRFDPLLGVPFYQPLMAHAAIHGGFVGVITGSVSLGLSELVIHAFVDDQKCAGHLSFNEDQAMHVFCKAVWVMTLILLGPLP